MPRQRARVNGYGIGIASPIGPNPTVQRKQVLPLKEKNPSLEGFFCVHIQLVGGTAPPKRGSPRAPPRGGLNPTRWWGVLADAIGSAQWGVASQSLGGSKYYTKKHQRKTYF